VSKNEEQQAESSETIVHESAEQKQERIAESVKILTELLEVACSCMNDPDPQSRAGAERDAKALAHAIKTMQGDPNA